MNLREALHIAVLNATRRLKDQPLALRVLAAEGRHIVAERDADDQAHARAWIEARYAYCTCGRMVADHTRAMKACKGCGRSVAA